MRTTSPPERVELRFSEPVEAEFDPVVVRAADGALVDAHDARVNPEDARIVLADLESVPRGTYSVKWRITSIDGHIVEGRYAFAVVAAGEDQPPPKMLGTGIAPPKPQGHRAATMPEVLGE